MSHSSLNSKYTVHLLEIVTLLLKEQSAEELAKVSENEINMASKRSMAEKEKDNELVDWKRDFKILLKYEILSFPVFLTWGK
jgi:hypothetical protein